MIRGTLPPALLAEAIAEGKRVTEINPNSRDTRGGGVDLDARYSRFIEGQIGEAAFCHAYGLPYITHIPWERRHEPDQHGCDIRFTRWRNGNLIIRRKDIEGRPNVLVFVQDGAYAVIGWAWTEEAKQDRWYRRENGWDRWMMPRAFLRSTGSLATTMGWDMQPTLPGVVA